jgi:hypothetical protein
MSPRLTSTSPAVLSYHSMRRAVGVLALSLPFVLACGSILLSLIGPDHALPKPVLQRSISDYRYTPMNNYLIGSLGAIAAFLVCSRGYDLADEIAGYFAGAFTMGVILFPSVNPKTPLHTPLQLQLQLAHNVFAALMFLTLAYFCLFLFRRSSPDKPRTRRKQHRNGVYTACGFVIIACSAIMVSINFDGAARWLRPIDPLFCSESLALIAFGVAWLTKGQGFLKDRPHNHAQPQSHPASVTQTHDLHTSSFTLKAAASPRPHDQVLFQDQIGSPAP